MKIFQPVLIFAFLLAACQSQATPELLDSPTPKELIPPTAEYVQCAWAWATQPLPEVDARLNQALQAANLDGWQANAAAFGENCLTGSGKVDHFAARDMDFYFVVKVTSLEDESLLSGLIEIATGLIAQLERKDTEPEPGMVHMRFQQEATEKNLNFQYSDFLALVSQGLKGADLFQALEKK